MDTRFKVIKADSAPPHEMQTKWLCTRHCSLETLCSQRLEDGKGIRNSVAIPVQSESLAYGWKNSLFKMELFCNVAIKVIGPYSETYLEERAMHRSTSFNCFVQGAKS